MIVRRVAHLVALVVIAGLMFGSSEASAAPEKADCQLFEIKATKDPKGGIDPALKPLAKKLSKPPFDSWKSFKLLAKHAQKVERMKPLELKLAPGGKLTLLYRDRIAERGKKPRLRLSLTLDSKSGKRVADLTIQLDSGDYNLIGGGTLPDKAAYILATTCKVK
jgi:hypothetical protein